MNSIYKTPIVRGFVFILLLTVFTGCEETGPIYLKSESKMQILPLGDSRVEGGRPHFESYRYELWKNLKQLGLEDFDFVGSIEDDGRFDDFQGAGGATTDYI